MQDALPTESKTPMRPFLLMEGGPLYNFQKRIGLLREGPLATKRRAIGSALVTFFPLLILSVLQHRAFSHVEVPFVRDFSTYSRFLLAVPLLIFAEGVLGPRIITAADEFIKAGIVAPKDYPKFAEFIDRGLRSRDSILAEVLLAILAYILSYVGFHMTAIHISTWYLTRSASGDSLTWAGLWLIGFCAPFFQFLIYRWIWRLFLWFQFLNRVRSLDLQLFPTHPDEAAGLGFVGEAQRFFGIILFALSIGTVGVLANDVFYDKVPLRNFTVAIVAYGVIAVLVLIAPLMIFAGTLMRVKRIGLHQYGALATAYTGAFHRKWILHQDTEGEPLLGTADLQSLADLGNSFSFIEKMKFLPVDLRTLLHLFVAALLPMAPLLLAIMPLSELLKLVFKILM